MLIRSVWVVHYESNSTKGWSCLHCIVSVITGCSVLSAGSCLPQLVAAPLPPRKSAAQVDAAAMPPFD